jgi:hypothetical protein
MTRRAAAGLLALLELAAACRFRVTAAVELTHADPLRGRLARLERDAFAGRQAGELDEASTERILGFCFEAPGLDGAARRAAWRALRDAIPALAGPRYVGAVDALETALGGR